MTAVKADDLEYLCVARWDDPEAMSRNRIAHVGVHVLRHRKTRLLHVLRFEDEKAMNAPTYIVKGAELILPPGGLPLGNMNGP